MKRELAIIDASPLNDLAVPTAGLHTDPSAVQDVLRLARQLRTALRLDGWDPDARDHAKQRVAAVLQDPDQGDRLRQAGTKLLAARQGLDSARTRFAKAAGREVRFDDGRDALADVSAMLTALADARHLLRDWSAWCRVRGRARAFGLGTLVEAIEDGAVSPERARDAFRIGYARWWLPTVLDADPVLRDFRRFQHENAIVEFRELDDLVRKHASGRVIGALAHDLPAVQSVPRNSELGLLRYQMELQRPSQSIRDLIGRMPDKFGKLARCMLMSPLSIAQYLPPNQALFDVVIFDEASQITTWDAVGAIARGRQTIIVGEARAQLGVLAPNGLEALRKEVAALASIDLAPSDVTDDPDQTRAALEAAELRRRQAVQAIRAAEPARSTANDAVVASETQLAVLRTREEQIAAVLGPQDGREERHRSLDAAVAEREKTLAKAQEAHDEQRAQTRDLAAADAALRRVRSVEQAAVAEAQQLRERIAGLTAHIVLKSDDAVEERWRETVEALEAATVRTGDFEREVAVLTRLTEALEAARTSARDLYLKPVMTELHPLLALLFEDATISFDDRTLLPHTITRQGQEENVDRLSGGMREQLSVLTRLAFARLLSRDGRPTPVILDDALVYSDDDRIERMFDALHRQADDQQIIVFSCRQRAFQKLGGNVLTTVDWAP